VGRGLGTEGIIDPMDGPPYSHTAIPHRPKLLMPEGKRLAVWAGVNIEHYSYGVPAISLAPFTAELVPDPLNYGWRDYGPRVGIWRLVEIFEHTGFPLTAIVNSDVCRFYPEIAAAGRERGWCWVGHGANNSTWQAGMAPDVEQEYLRRVTAELVQATGTRPIGWLGPALTASPRTYDFLVQLGYRYALDWSIDDEPVDLRVDAGPMCAVPYPVELNDLPFFAIQGQSAADFADALVDQFEQLYEESAERPRVMAFGLHPFLSGQPFRARHLHRAMAHMARYEDAWFTTSDEVAALQRVGGA
jgi:allantoinase